MNQDINNNLSDDGIISLYDIWKKIREYKKTFLGVFLFTFIIGGGLVLSTPLKYVFSQVIEIGGSINDGGTRYSFIELEDAVLKIKKVLLPTVVHMYNLKSSKNLIFNAENFKVEKAGSNILLLSIEGPLRNQRYL